MLIFLVISLHVAINENHSFFFSANTIATVLNLLIMIFFFSNGEKKSLFVDNCNDFCELTFVFMKKFKCSLCVILLFVVFLEYGNIALDIKDVN